MCACVCLTIFFAYCTTAGGGNKGLNNANSDTNGGGGCTGGEYFKLESFGLSSLEVSTVLTTNLVFSNCCSFIVAVIFAIHAHLLLPLLH